LSNAVRHAEPTLVSISSTVVAIPRETGTGWGPERDQVVVADDGQGMREPTGLATVSSVCASGSAPSAAG